MSVTDDIQRRPSTSVPVTGSPSVPCQTSSIATIQHWDSGKSAKLQGSNSQLLIRFFSSLKWAGDVLMYPVIEHVHEPTTQDGWTHITAKCMDCDGEPHP